MTRKTNLLLKDERYDESHSLEEQQNTQHAEELEEEGVFNRTQTQGGTPSLYSVGLEPLIMLSQIGGRDN